MKKPTRGFPLEAVQYNFCRNYRFTAEDRDDIGVLLSKAWEKCGEVGELPPVKKIEGNFPIVWLGDMEAYLRSETRVVTVGLNPTDREFSALRFFTYAERKLSKGEPKFRGRVPLTRSHWENGEFDRIFWAYNNYFHFKPFGAYFNCYERALQSLGCDVSYAGRKLGDPTSKNTAIHIHLKSPIATKPNWNKLKASEKESVACDTFHALLSYLRPDIVLFSAGREDFLSAAGLRVPVFAYPLSFEEESLLEYYRKGGVNYVWGSPEGGPFKKIPEESRESVFSELRKYFTPLPKPDEGVFWIVPHIPRERLSRLYKIFKFEVTDGVVLFNESMRESGHYIVSVFDHTQKSHYELWKAVKAKYPELAEFHYEFFPCGRVWTNGSGQSVIYSHEEFEWEAFLGELKPLFRLKEIAHHPGMRRARPPATT